MRCIKSFESKELAVRFSDYLTKMKIENSLDISLDESKKIQIWVHNEDFLDEASNYLKSFEKNPKSNIYDPEIIIKNDVLVKEKPVFRYFLTPFFLGICVLFYFLNFTQEIGIKNKNPGLNYVILTPIQSILLYDKPTLLIEASKTLDKYKIDPQKSITDQSEDVKKAFKQLEEKPIFRGFYPFFLGKKIETENLFEKIKQGQIWRAFTPCLLHTGLLHLVFNMLWLWLLGKQIEERVSRKKFFFFIVLVGILTNTLQYLMTGPYFLGFSGVIMGMVGFIYAREKKAPWEGYPLQKSVFLFLGFYIFLMLFLSIFSFAAKAFEMDILAPNIANTAHISGAIIGYLFGRTSLFAQSEGK